MPMPPIQFIVSMFRGEWDQARSQLVLLYMMEALTKINQSIIAQNRSMVQRKMIPASELIPPLYRADIHYEREPPGQEEWPDIINMMNPSPDRHQGEFGPRWDDCEDLAGWRCAELRELAYYLQGVGKDGKPMVADPRFEKGYAGSKWKKVKGGMKARPFAKWRKGPTGAYHYHALVLLPDGRIEDPSLVLGMGKEAIFAEKNVARLMAEGKLDPVIQYAKAPDVMVVDPESPTGFNDRRTEKEGQIGIPGKDLVSGTAFNALASADGDKFTRWKPLTRFGQEAPAASTPEVPVASPALPLEATDFAAMKDNVAKRYLRGFASRTVHNEAQRILNLIPK